MDNSKKPNILFLMADQLRWDALGCTGGIVKTPNIDSIASEGVVFRNCVTNSPVCIPARVSLATGIYPHNNGVWTNSKYTLPEGSNTWMKEIRELGYRTSLFGKTHLHPHHGDLRQREYLLHAYGLDDVNEIAGPRASTGTISHMTAEWEGKGLWESYKKDLADRYRTIPYVARPSTLPLEYYADVYVGQTAKKYLEKYDREEPWFCWVSFGGPHEPWDAPEPYASMYDPETMPEPLKFSEKSKVIENGYLRQRLDKSLLLSIDDIKNVRANYAGNVTLIDDQIGEILSTIRRRGELSNTVIVLTSDHGEMNGDYGLLYKQNFLNSSVRVPLIIRIPETVYSEKVNNESEALVEMFDIGPTLVELAGGHIEYKNFAISICPVLKEEKASCRDYVISEVHNEIMIMNHDWKMVLNKERQPYLLFDIKEDPNETMNLASTEKAKSIEESLNFLILRKLLEC